MKIRNGFVTNSSSADFLIGVKGEITEERIRNIFKVPEDSLFYPYVEMYAKYFVERVNSKSTLIITPDMSETERKKIYKKTGLEEYAEPILNKGKTFINFRVEEIYNGEEEFEDELLYYLVYDYESDDLEIEVFLP